MRDSSIKKTIKSSDYKPWLVSGILFTSDILALVLSFLIAIKIREALIPSIGGIVDLEKLLPELWLTILLIIGEFSFNQFYPGARRIGVVEVKEIIKIVSSTYAILGLIIFLLGFGNQFSRYVFFISWFLSCVFISIFRLFIHNRGSLYSWWGQPVLVVGYKNDVKKVIQLLTRARRLAIKPVVALVFDNDNRTSIIDGIPYIPFSVDAQKEIRASGIDQALFVNHLSDLSSISKKRLFLLSLSFSRVIYVLGESPLSSMTMDPIDLEGRPALRVKYNLFHPLAINLKRFFEILICIFGSVIIIPLFLILSLLIALDSRGPFIYKQKRLGKDGRVIDIYKFRTMEVDAESRLQELLRDNTQIRNEYNKYRKIHNDPRITRVGKFLRKTSLDELPQVWNVLRGEMSLVGPRAYLPEEKDMMGDNIDLILRVPPGITGWWQVMGRNERTFEERIKLDCYYISNFSLWLDFYILIKTVWIVLSGNGE